MTKSSSEGSTEGGRTDRRLASTRRDQQQRTHPSPSHEKLQETLTDGEKIAIHQRDIDGELSGDGEEDDATEVLVGNALGEIERERTTFEEASEIETAGVFQERMGDERRHQSLQPAHS